MKTPTPFRKAESLEKRLKLLLWGDAGSGKTTLALQFPKPVVIDLEGSSDLYGDKYGFDVLRASNADEVMRAVEWLHDNTHAFRTILIDPVTVYWDALQRKWSEIFLRRNKQSKGFRFEYYDLQPRDWMTIKAEFKHLIRQLIALDMNVIVTARQKTQYSDAGFMRAIGETFDGEKSLPYLFDTIVRLYRDEKGKFKAECLKDRSQKLPLGKFTPSYAMFERLFGRETLDREATPVARVTDQQKQRITGYITKFGMSPEQVNDRLATYGATSVEDLTEESAAVIIEKFEAATANRKLQ